MNGYDLLKFLTEAPRESLDQEILFEVELHTAPEQLYSGQVPIIHGNVMPDDQLLTPSGHLLTPDQAMQIFKTLKQDFATGLVPGTEEEVNRYMPFNLPKILSDKQILFKLQVLKGYDETSGQPLPDNSEEPEIYDPANEGKPVLKISHWGPVGES